jgi:adenylate cyclase
MRLIRIRKVNKLKLKSLLFISFFWTLTDFVVIFFREDVTSMHSLKGLLLRELIIFVLSIVMGYLFVFRLKKIFKDFPLWINFMLKSLILILSAFIITFIIHFGTLVALHVPPAVAAHRILELALFKDWLVQKILYWMIIFFVTQLFILINERYSPGVFIDIMLGKYIQPRIEKRIVMFMDLKDSTPIAEKLGHQQYFKFIRDFIYQVSTAILEFEGRIYQYVGDEVVASWPFSHLNTRKCMDAIIETRKYIQKRSEYFRTEFGIVPEFRVGIHVGDVTVGEIGVIKKDLAMSGDTMNTTARIRSACNELNQKFIVSKDFIENINLEEWQSESLGIVELKGKGHGIELYSLKI